MGWIVARWSQAAWRPQREAKAAAALSLACVPCRYFFRGSSGDWIQPTLIRPWKTSRSQASSNSFRSRQSGRTLPRVRQKARVVVAVEEVADFVGDDVLHGRGGGLDQSPVDADYAILAAGARHAFLFADAGV